MKARDPLPQQINLLKYMQNLEINFKRFMELPEAVNEPLIENSCYKETHFLSNRKPRSEFVVKNKGSGQLNET